MSTQPQIPNITFGPPPPTRRPLPPTTPAVTVPDLTFAPTPVRAPPGERPTVSSLGFPTGIGDRIYRSQPGAIVAAIGAAEGVPSFGNMVLAARYGGHEKVPRAVARAATARLVHRRYREWVGRGKPGDFLDYLRDRYAPLGAANDPTNLNVHWLPNVLDNLPSAVVNRAARTLAVGPGASEQAKAQERLRRAGRIEEQFAATPDLTPREVFIEGVRAQGARVVEKTKRGISAAGAVLSAGAKQIITGEAGTMEELFFGVEKGPFIDEPRIMLGPLGQVVLGTLGGVAALPTAIGDVVLADTMALMHQAKVPEPVIIAYGTIVQTAIDVVTDPTWIFIFGRALPKAAARLSQQGVRATRETASAELRRAISEVVSDPALDPAVRAQLATQQAKVEAAIREADAMLARRERVGRVQPTGTQPVLLEKPAPERIGALALEPGKPLVSPVRRAPVRERVPTAADRAAAAEVAEEELQRRLSQVRAAGGVLRAEPPPVRPELVAPGRPSAPPGKVIPVAAAPVRERLGRPQVSRAQVTELTSYGWTRLQIADMTPDQAQRALAAGRGKAGVAAAAPEPVRAAAPVQVPPEIPPGFARPAPEARPVRGAVRRFSPGDEVLYARDGDTYRIERVGPRGYGLVDVQTGRRRISVMHDDLASAPDLLRKVPSGAGRLLETEPVRPALALEGQEAAARPEIGRQVGLEASGALSRQLEAEAAARTAAARAARRPGVSRKPPEEQTIGQAVRSKGGISLAQSPDITGELDAVRRQRRFPLGIISRGKTARSWGADDLAKSLNEEGFRHSDGREIAGADLPRLLEDEFLGRRPKSQFLHPASTDRFREDVIRKAEQRHAMAQEGVLTGNVEKHLDLSDREQAGVLKALGRAMGELGEPKTAKAFAAVAARATKIYNTELLPKMGKRAVGGAQSPRFFEDVLRADLSESGLPVRVTGAKTVATDPDMPLAKRIETAHDHADALADDLRADSAAATPQERAKQNLWHHLKDESGRAGVIGEILEPTAQALRLATKVRKGAVSQAETVVRKMGSEGDDLARRMRAFHRDHRLDVGDDVAHLRRFEQLSDESWDRARAAAEGADVQLTAPERALLPVAQRILTRVREDALAEGMEVGFLEHYWPIRLREDLLRGRVSDAVREIMVHTGADEERALAQLLRWRRDARTGRPFGNLERSREAWAPYWVRKPAKQELLEYAYYGRRRIVEVRYFGGRDERFNELLARIRDRDPQDGAFVEAWFDAETRRAPKEVFLEDIARTISDTVAAKSMVLSVISNTAQPMNNLFITDVGTFARGWRRLVSPMTREEAVEFGVRTGGALEQGLREMIGEIAGRERGLTEKVTRRTGFLGREGANRTITAVIGREWARDLSEALVRSDATRPSWLRGHKLAAIERHLRQVDLDPESIRERAAQLRSEGKLSDALQHHRLLTDREERMAALKLVDLTQFPMNPGSVPLLWNSPWLRLATMFKRFPYKQGQLVWQSIVGEGRHGNLKPLVIFLAAFPVVGAGIRDVRTFLRHPIQAVTDPEQAFRGGLAISNPWRDPVLNLAYVGGVGIASDLVRALSARVPREAIASFLGGPVFTEGTDILGLIAEFDQPVRGVKRTIRKAIDLLLTPGLAGAFGIPGAVLGETIERAGILRTLPVPGRRRRRRRRRGSVFSGA